MKNEFFWSDAYLIILEENFDKVFKEIYEHTFIDILFNEYESKMERKYFLVTVAGEGDSMP